MIKDTFSILGIFLFEVCNFGTIKQHEILAEFVLGNVPLLKNTLYMYFLWVRVLFLPNLNNCRFNSIKH